MTDERLEELLEEFGAWCHADDVFNNKDTAKWKLESKQAILNHIKENYRRNDEQTNRSP